MNQLTIDFTSLADASASGAAAAQACIDKAQHNDPEFSAKAERAILAHLQAVGQASGEVLTDVAIANGARPHDQRAMGPVFQSLLRRNLVRVIGYAPRVKGHGCMGAKVYALGF